MLANPNLTPIGYTDRKFDSQEAAKEQQEAMQAAQAGQAPPAAQDGQTPGQPPSQETPAQPEIAAHVVDFTEKPNTMGDALAAEQISQGQALATQSSPNALSAFGPFVNFKSEKSISCSSSIEFNILFDKFLSSGFSESLNFFKSFKK